MPAISTPHGRLYTLTPRFDRQRFIEGLILAAGTPPLAGLVLNGSETTTTVCPWSGRVWTADASIAAQITALGNGYARTMAAASSRYWTTPDTVNLTFGNGSLDGSMSWVALINTGDTAANKTLFSKYDASNTEYIVGVSSAEVAYFNVYDHSAGVAASRTSNAAVPLGSWILLGGTYEGNSGGSGATSANFITLYLNGAVLASTATNNAAYVAMEDKTAPLEIGSIATHTAQFFDGAYGFMAIYSKPLSLGSHAEIAKVCRSYYRLAL